MLRLLLSAFLFAALPAAAQSPQEYIRAAAQPMRLLGTVPPQSAAAFAGKDVLMMGELHGTNEPVRFAVALAEALARQGDSVLFGFEIAEKELGSFPQDRNMNQLAATPFFRGSTNDNRGNRAWYDALVRVCRNPRLQAFFFDPGSVPGRDSLMALAILRARAAHPGWKVVTLSGNVHNRRSGYKGERCAAGYLELLAPELAGKLATINIAFAEGSMRNNTGNGIETHSVDNRDSDFAQAAPAPIYLLPYPPGTYAYDFVLFVQKLTAAEAMD